MVAVFVYGEGGIDVSDESKWALLAADTDRTQDYVFESARLPEIRGASRQLDDLNQKIREIIEERDPESNVIFANGGGLLALVSPDKAPVLTCEIEALYPSKTTVATITADCRPITPEMLEQGYPPNPQAPFGALVRWAGTWLRRRKESKPVHPFVESLPHAHRCASCQTRPVNPITLSFYPDWLLCDVCLAKRHYIGRDFWFQAFQDYLDDPKHSEQCQSYYGSQRPFPSFREKAEDGDRLLTRWTPQDLSEIGAACVARPGYVGLIYLDGDEMGHAFEQVPTSEAYTSLSNAVYQASEDAVMSALSQLHPAWVHPSPARPDDEKPLVEQMDEQGRMRIHPFEIITIGGDDIILIVPADKVLSIAYTISQTFQARLCELLAGAALPQTLKEQPYTMSGGVVLASDHNPVRVLRDLAYELKDIAKKERKEREREGKEREEKEQREIKASEGYIDFLVLKSADMIERNVRQMRKRYPYCLEEVGAKPLCLLGRPYAASVLKVLWCELEALRKDGKFPPSQMNQLAESLLQGRHESTLFYLYQRARDKKGYFAYMDRTLVAVQGSDARNPTPWVSWSGTDHRYSFRTVVWDIAELYDFVPGGAIVQEASND